MTCESKQYVKKLSGIRTHLNAKDLTSQEHYKPGSLLNVNVCVKVWSAERCSY